MTSITEKNARSYNKNAQLWAENAQKGLAHKYIEKPAMEKELPNDLTGKSVLCIGVGSGYELDEIINKNPKKIIGIDISKELLKIASAKYPDIEFKKMDMMKMSFSDNVFDLVYSSLAFHYANDWDALLTEVHRVLRIGGVLLFSTHNPDFWGQKPKTGKVFTNKRGVTLTEHTATLPAGNIDIIFYNHPNERSIKDSLDHSRFKVKSFFTPSVVELSADQLEGLDNDDRDAYNKLKIKNSQVPFFLIARAVAF
jgi:ubiquinone/menaquinone biosynthesis C-methylase UbiE